MPSDLPGSLLAETSPSNAGVAGLIPSWGARIPHASQPKKQNIKQKQNCNKFNKDFTKKKGCLWSRINKLELLTELTETICIYAFMS